ncbi:hypothetical protein BKP43_22860 [Variovorax boronicumulans]|uniref:retron Ec48 family effector membrane protein n=1 Tax=Variovorax boronicumulans TaxID=436515 RepID=UPI00117E40B4|nr:retron Ec48 family effector membrane protein [Variovorax boronicumulans]PBI91229.1 hypothetical protein BKP43_22860 [Variovorax boronicumulans]
MLGAIISTILLVGLVISAVMLTSTLLASNSFERPLCFQNSCVKEFLSDTDQSFSVAKATFDFGVAIATIGGIFVALLSYFTAASNGALTNHIEHLKVFGEYLESEILKREKLSTQSIDRLLLYGLIFNQSRVGKTTVSDEYRKFLEDLNSIIFESNERCVVGTPGGFSYNDHQRKVKGHMAQAGIFVYHAPRNDYFEMEEQLFSLIHRISQSFCPPNTLPKMLARTYY